MTDHDHDAVSAFRQAADQDRNQGTVDVEDVMRSGAERRQAATARRTVVAGALTAAAVIAGVGLTVGPGHGAALGPSGPDDPVAALSLLARPPVAGDDIPAVDDSVTDEAGPYGMVAGSTRLVVEDDGVGYFAGVDPQGEVCLLVHLQAQSQVASSCAPPERFGDTGVWVSTSDDSGIAVTGLLLPDRLTESAAGDLDDLRERAGIGADGETRLLAPNVLAVVDRPAAATSPTAAVATPTTEAPADDGGIAVPGDDVPVEVAGITWELVAIDGDAVELPVGEEITFVVDGDQARTAAACNGYVASWSADGGRVTVGGLSGTRRGCRPDVETAGSSYLVALPRVTAASRDGDRLRLTGDGVDLRFTARQGP